MKLFSRKSLVALCTTSAVALTGITVPAASADTVKSSPDYAARLAKVSSQYTVTTNRYNKAESTFLNIGKNYPSVAKSNDYRKVGDELSVVKSYIDQANQLQQDLPKTGNNDSEAYGRMRTILDNLSDANVKLTTAQTDLNAIMPLQCDADSTTKSDDDSGSSGFDLGSLFASLGSSGQMKITKDGKERCVSRVDYYVDKLKSIVSILTVVFTVITTVNKISSTLQSQMQPKN